MFETVKYQSREERIIAMKQMIERSKLRHEQSMRQLKAMYHCANA